MSIPPTAFGGKPQRYRQVQADFHGHVAELLAKSTKQGALDQAVTKQDREILMMALQELGRAGCRITNMPRAWNQSNRRGFDVRSRRRAEFRAGAVRTRRP